MNILVMHCRYRLRGGEDAVVENDIKILKEMGHRVVPYILSNSALDEMGTAGRIKTALEYVFPFRQTALLRKVIREKNIDVIWVHNTLWMTGTAAYEAGRDCHIPVIQTVHNYRLLCPNGLCFRNGRTCCDCIYGAGEGRSRRGLINAVLFGCYRKSRILSFFVAAGLLRARRKGLYKDVRFVCLTGFQKHLITGAVPGISEDNVYIKHNHVKCDVKTIPYKSRKNRFVYAGRLSREKGIPELLKSWRLIEEHAKRTGAGDMDVPELMICGGGPLSEYVRKYTGKHDLNYVNYVGELSSGEADGIIAESRALIYPTRIFEGEPMSIIEAYMTGTPVIATDTGSISELVCDGVTGRLISMEKPVKDLVDIILTWSLSYEPAAIKEFSGRFSKEDQINSIKIILNQ